MTPEELTAALHLLEVDYERTTKFIEGVVATGATIRGWTITLTVALLGVAFERHLWEMGVVAIVLIVMFGFVDGYHSWLYAEALSHAGHVEKTLGLYYAGLASDGDPDAQFAFDVELRVHRFGPFSNFKRFRLVDLKTVRPRFVLVTLYATLLIIAAAGTVLVAARNRTTSVDLSCTAVQNAPPGTLICVTK
jgi:hypothetical protein